mgnify:FL=1
MKDNELAPVIVEIVKPEELDQISVLGKIDKDNSGGVSLTGKVDAVLGIASNVLDAVEGANLYKVEVPDGYTLQDLIKSSKDDGSLRALVKDANGKLNGDVSLRLNGISPAQVASVGLSAAAMVVGQAYMTEISDTLHSIDSKLDSVMVMIAGEQKAKVKNAIDIAKTYMQLFEDYQGKPSEALQAARIEIESRYNDIGEVIDWITEQLADIERRAKEIKPAEKDISTLLDELDSYKEKFELCLQALSALALTRMYYDGCVDQHSALVEQQRIALKSQHFLYRYQRISGIIELQIGAIKGAPVALPQGSREKNIFKRLTSQTPRAAAKEQLLVSKTRMQAKLRGSNSELKERLGDYVAGINRVSSLGQATRTMLTDGTDFWIIEDKK